MQQPDEGIAYIYLHERYIHDASNMYVHNHYSSRIRYCYIRSHQLLPNLLLLMMGGLLINIDDTSAQAVCLGICCIISPANIIARHQHAMPLHAMMITSSAQNNRLYYGHRHAMMIWGVEERSTTVHIDQINLELQSDENVANRKHRYIITTSAQDNQEHSNWRSRGEAHSLGPRATRQGVGVVRRGGGGQGQRCRLADTDTQIHYYNQRAGQSGAQQLEV